MKGSKNSKPKKLPTMPKNDLHQKLAAWRKKRGLTQLELSSRMGHGTAQFVSNWERGISKPPRSSLRKLCKVLECDVEEVCELYVAAAMQAERKLLAEEGLLAE